MSVSRYYDVKRDGHGNRYLEVYVQGFLLQRFPLLNKGTAFTEEERRELGLEGLLPPGVVDIEVQKDRVYRLYSQIQDNLEKHIYLRNLQDRNEVMFYSLVSEHMEELLPILYTPTVGEAVRKFSHIYRYPRGFAASTRNIDRLKESLANLPLNEVRLIVATDSSAILGIGDQGFGGLAISIGKLTIYTAAGGVAPDKTLPVELDVGTDRKDLLEDPLYLGVRHTRLKGQEYLDFVDKFIAAIREHYPKAVIQWEDFSKDAAHAVLERYRKQVPSFNDDIQGTGAVALAGLISAGRLKGEKLSDQRFLVHGAGAGGTGVAWAIVEGLKREGLSHGEALSRIFVLDAKGLLIEGRSMEDYKKPFAQQADAVRGWSHTGPVPDLLEVIRQGKVTALLGLSGVGGCFNEAVIKAVHANTPRPIIFPMSNPTANTEALPGDVIAWTDGQAIVATGSPFPDVHYKARDYPVGQGNNAFVFPGLGFAAVLGLVREVSDAMVLEGAYALAEYTEHETPERVYPAVSHLREVSADVATRVLQQAMREGLTREPRIEGMSSEQLSQFVRARMWEARYLPFRYQRVGV